jgi:UDP-N-acetylglucosamine--N-acetylmuramyl-(pentapeptide) pyrophosphoryl-undecaprenol N-acetylglucosamine transferase
LVQKNAALLCKDGEATENIADMLLELLRNQSQLDMLSKEIIKLGKPNAAESIVNEIMKDLG